MIYVHKKAPKITFYDSLKQNGATNWLISLMALKNCQKLRISCFLAKKKQT